MFLFIHDMTTTETYPVRPVTKLKKSPVNESQNHGAESNIYNLS